MYIKARKKQIVKEVDNGLYGVFESGKNFYSCTLETNKTISSDFNKVKITCLKMNLVELNNHLIYLNDVMNKLITETNEEIHKINAKLKKLQLECQP